MGDPIDLPDTRDPVQRIAHECALDVTPIDVTAEPDFDAFVLAVDDLADGIEQTLRAEVPA